VSHPINTVAFSFVAPGGSLGNTSTVQIAGFLVLAGAALIVALAVGNQSDNASTSSDRVATALANFKLNESLADSSPQQTVTAEWAAKDLLAVMGRAEARQSSALGTKIPLLLLLGVFGVCWHGATLPAREP
jgi:hypothetical protein